MLIYQFLSNKWYFLSVSFVNLIVLIADCLTRLVMIFNLTVKSIVFCKIVTYLIFNGYVLSRHLLMCYFNWSMDANLPKCIFSSIEVIIVQKDGWVCVWHLVQLNCSCVPLVYKRPKISIDLIFKVSADYSFICGLLMLTNCSTLWSLSGITIEDFTFSMAKRYYKENDY